MSEAARHSSGQDPRRRARRRAVQALYQWQVTQQDAGEVIVQFLEEQDMSRVDVDYFKALVRGVAGERALLDETLQAHLDRDIERVDPIERAILRLGAFELLRRLEVPYRVVLDEAVELAHRFGAEHGHTYVNAVLDRAAGHWRAGERPRGVAEDP